jgi:D-glycero-D-manno-heptose 1,7-bisphosphate phosphatase
MHAAVFLDRDGTVFVDTDYPKNPDEVVWLPGAVEGMRLMIEKGYLLFIVSNQSGVARGLIKYEEFSAVHRRAMQLVAAEGLTVEEWGYCLHAPEINCQCRKPKPGLIARSSHGHPLDLGASCTVGDKLCDLELADAVGATGYLVLTGKGHKTMATLERNGSMRQYKVRADLLAVAQDLPG